MKTSDQGIEFVKQHEGVRLNAYQDSVGIWTIGVGHTGKDVAPGMVIDDKEVDRLLKLDLEEVEKCIDAFCDVELTQCQFDALGSLIFNIGCGAFKNSTLLQLLNQKNYRGAAQQFSRWCRAGGNVIPGLLSRRKDEIGLFLKVEA
jgi:lysozyme